MTSSISYDKEIGSTWTKITEASDGDIWEIQPLNANVRFIILEDAPTTEQGGIIEALDRYVFQKVSGDLYLKDIDGLGKVNVYVTKHEVPSDDTALASDVDGD